MTHVASPLKELKQGSAKFRTEDGRICFFHGRLLTPLLGYRDIPPVNFQSKTGRMSGTAIRL